MLETLSRRPEREPSPHRRRGLLVLLILILLMVGGLGAAGAYYQWSVGASGPQRPIVLTIPEGATGTEVAELLEEEGVVRSRLAFRLVARFRGYASGFQAGKYRMKTNLSVLEALEILGRGPFVDTVRVTFPEGWTLEQMAQRVKEALGVKASTFLKLARGGRYSLEPYLPAGTDSTEGFLFPNTYDFLKDTSADGVIRRMLDQFRRVADGLPWKNAAKLGLTPYEAVVVASMIEREARAPGEHALISAVIHNRLRVGMRLEIDATVRYALDKPSGPLTKSDLDVDSPYNTRKHAGLPPTPIANPGLESLKAALQPADVDYLYFLVVDPSTGRHEFTSSYDEFVRLKRQSTARG